MNESTPENEAEINWRQVEDLIGDEGDLAQMEMLADMWRDMVADVRAEWSRLEASTDNDEVRRTLHRVRGVIAMWGLERLSGRMQGWELAASPLEGWRLGKDEAAEALKRGFAMVERRYPGLVAKK